MTNIEPVSDAQARRAALLVGAVFGLLSAWQLYRGRFEVFVVLSLFASAVAASAAVPATARAFYRRWMQVASVLGFINTRVLLGTVFYLLMTPIGVAARIVGYDPMVRRQAREKSYWRLRAASRQSREGYERAF